MLQKLFYGQALFILSSLCIACVSTGCSCASNNNGGIPPETISFIYIDNAPGGWDRLSFQAYNDDRENRLVYSGSMIDSTGIGEVHVLWKGGRFDIASLSDEDQRVLEEDGFRFLTTPFGYDVSYTSSGENPPFNLLIKISQGVVTQVSLYSRGYPDPAMGDVSFMPISIEIAPGKFVSFPQDEDWVLKMFGKWDLEHISSGY